MKRYRVLDFDSALFGYQVAAISIDEKNAASLPLIIQNLKAKNIKLAYLTLSNVSDEQHQLIEANGGKWVDEKFHIKWQLPLEDNNNHLQVVEYSGEYTDSLKRLFRQSGLFSRFALDASFVADEYNKLYDSWARQLLSFEQKGKVFVYKMPDEQIVGLATREYRGKYAFLGHMVVDASFRGRGIGRALISTLNNRSYQEGYEEMHCIVHRNNQAALNLYKPFNVVSLTTTFHFWL